MKKLFLLFSFSVVFLAVYPLPFRERVAELEQKAEKGDSAAMYHLATLYERGFDSIPSDSVRSDSLLRMAALRGYAPAQNLLGYRLYPLSPDSGIYWLRQAAAGGDLKAQSNLAYLLLQSDSSIDMTERARRDSIAAAMLAKGAEAGIPTSISTLADLYREGRGVERDTLRATLLYLEAVSGGLADAEIKLLSMNQGRYRAMQPGEALEEGLRAAKSGAHTVAFDLYMKAAEGNIPRAFTLLGDAYSSAKGTDYNHSLALSNYLKGAEGGDPSAQFILAELLEIFPDALPGTDSGRNPQYWYARAKEQGVNDAKEAMMRLFR
ncbi:MAG: sel1 repeat family protein [Muribaculaceae bacterium]|nr:sel1 repeat family protein [Muribaculaceae bacterium]